jgi:hypothetical protein
MSNSNHISVAEALARLRRGDAIAGATIDFRGAQVKARDAFALGKAGIEVPDAVIVYDDADVAADPEFDDYTWERTEEDPLADPPDTEKLTVDLSVDAELRAWIQRENIPLQPLLEQLLRDFYATYRMTRDKK